VVVRLRADLRLRVRSFASEARSADVEGSVRLRRASLRRRVALHANLLVGCQTTSPTSNSTVVWGTCGRNSGAATGTRSACSLCDAEGVSCDTGEVSAEYASSKSPSNSTICDGRGQTPPGHHASANPGAARRRRQGPKPRTCIRAVGAQRRGLDGAEHSSILGRVMAGRETRVRRGHAIGTMQSWLMAA